MNENRSLDICVSTLGFDLGSILRPIFYKRITSGPALGSSGFMEQKVQLGDFAIAGKDLEQGIFVDTGM